MKALLLASAGTVLYLALVTLLFRMSAPKRRALAMLKLFAATVPLLVMAHVLTPPDLGVLPPFLTEPFWPVDFAFMVFVYAAGFFGGSLQLYNLAERGFSLRILMDVVEASGGTLTLAEVRRGYSRGRGVDWMFEKRLNDMQAGEMIALADGMVHCRERGLRAGRLAGWVRDFLHLENKL